MIPLETLKRTHSTEDVSGEKRCRSGKTATEVDPSTLELVTPFLHIDPPKVVLVRKNGLSPARLRVTFGIDRPCPTLIGYLFTNPDGRIRLYDGLIGGGPLAALPKYRGDALYPGVNLYIEGAVASDQADGVELSLAVFRTTATPPEIRVGPTARDQMTSVELTLDILTPSPGLQVVPYPQKVTAGRPVQVASNANAHQRAAVIIRAPQPPIGTHLLLDALIQDIAAGPLAVYADADQVPGVGQQRDANATIELPVAQAPRRYWVELRDFHAGRGLSLGLRLDPLTELQEGDQVNVSPIPIELVHDGNPASPATGFVRMGLWDDAFDVLNLPALGIDLPLLNAGFIDNDSRRFHIRVQDPARAGQGHVNVSWGTTDDNPNNPQITLVEHGGNPGIFSSRALMLVSDEDDRQVRTDSGLPVGLPDHGQERGVDETNHRLRKASINGMVVAVYGASLVVGSVFRRNPEERKTVSLQVFALRWTPGVNLGLLDATFSRDMRTAREVYARIGVHVETVVDPTAPVNDLVTVGVDRFQYIDAPARQPVPLVSMHITYAEETWLGTNHLPVTVDTVRVFYVTYLANGSRGESYPDYLFPQQPQQGCAFVCSMTGGPWTLAHEVGHVLTDKIANTGHYRAGGGNRQYERFNLLVNGTGDAEGALESKRLWDSFDADGWNQVGSTRNSHYLRPYP